MLSTLISMEIWKKFWNKYQWLMKVVHFVSESSVPPHVTDIILILAIKGWC